MNEKTIVDRLLKAEKARPELWAVTYKGVDVWPIFRVRLSEALEQSTRNDYPVRLYGTFSFLTKLRAQFAAWRSRFSHVDYDQFKKSDFLLLSVSGHRNDIVDGKLFSRIMDSIDQLKPKLYTSTFLEFVGGSKKVNRYGNPIVLNDFMKFELIRIFAKRAKGVRFDEHISHKELITNMIKELGLDPEEEFFEFGLEGELYHRLIPIADKILERVEPKLLLNDMYYYHISFALTMAARKRGIPSCDIQHGVQGAYHYAYKFANAPQICGPLPDVFWVWEKSDQENIDQYLHESAHQTVVGGNPHMCYSKRNIVEVDQKTNEIVLVLGGDYPEFNELVSNVVIPVIKVYGDKYLWVVRQHPEHIGFANKVISAIEQEGVGHLIRRQDIRKEPLFETLSSCAYCVTFDSTVAIESIKMGLKSIVIGQNGFEIFRKYIDENQMVHVDGVNSFVEAIVAGSSEKLQIGDSEAESDDLLVERTINWLLQKH